MPSLSSDNSVNVVIGTEADDSGISKVSQSLGGMVDNFQSGMRKISLATGAVAVGLTAFAKNSTDYLTGLVSSSKELSRETGESVEQSSALIQAFNRVGISADQAATTFKIFAKQINESRENSAANALQEQQLKNKIDATKISIKDLSDEVKKHGDKTGELKNKIQGLNIQLQEYQQELKSTSNPLERLNVATRNADGTARSFNDILLNVADKFKVMPDGAEKTAIALQLFGRSGADMIKILDKGSEGIQELEKNAEKLGLTLTAQNIGAIQNYIQSQKDLQDTTNSIKIAVGSLTAPVLTKFNQKLNEVAQSLMGVGSPLRTITADVLAFGGPVLGATSAVAGFLGNIGSASGILKGIVGLLSNPVFLIFAAAVAAIGAAVYILQRQLGGWSNLMTAIKQDMQKVWDVIDKYLGPSLKALWSDIQSDLLPALKELLRQLEPVLLPALKLLGEYMGGQLIAALWLLINVIRIIVEIMGWWVNVIDKIAEGFKLMVDLAKVGLHELRTNFAETIGEIIGFFATLPLRFGFYIEQMVARGIHTITSVNWHAVLEVIAVAFVAMADRAYASMDNLWHRLMQINWGGVITKFGKDMANSIVDMIESAINTAFKSIPGHPHVSLPRFEKGVRNFSGGLAVVGDVAGRGGEIVSLPPGSNVYSNQESKQMMRGMGGMTVNQYIYNQVDYSRGLAEIGFRLSNA